MFNFSLLLDNEIQSDFLTSFLPILRYILFGLIIASAIVLIVTTLMQSNDSNNSIDAFTGGGQESYYAQNKGASRDGILKKSPLQWLQSSSFAQSCSSAHFLSTLCLKHQLQYRQRIGYGNQIKDFRVFKKEGLVVKGLDNLFLL